MARRASLDSGFRMNCSPRLADVPLSYPAGRAASFMRGSGA
jgi:hypothetical protein